VKSLHEILLSDPEENARKDKTFKLRHYRLRLGSCPDRAREQNTACAGFAGSPRLIPETPVFGPDRASERTNAMAKGQMRQSKEKKKPKQDQEKKKGTSAYAQAYHAQTSNSPIGKKD
jgi:hypothetical protein